MARNVSLNTQKQNFLREAYYKEAMTRVKWHEKYYHDVAHFNKLCDPTEEEKRKTRIKRLQEAVPKFPKGKVIPVIDYPPKGMSRKEELEEDERYKEEIDEDLCDMRPVSPGMFFRSYLMQKYIATGILSSLLKCMTEFVYNY